MNPRGIGNDTLELYADWKGYKSIARSVIEAVGECNAVIKSIQAYPTGSVYVWAARKRSIIKIRISDHEGYHTRKVDVRISPDSPLHGRRDLTGELLAAFEDREDGLC